MDDELKEQSAELKRLNSEDAATWLMETYPVESPDYGQAMLLLPHRSWKKSDQMRLARYYFQKLPFASSKPYEVFASFMSLSNMVKIILEFMPTTELDMNLLVYHLEPTLKRNLKSTTDKDMVDQFLARLK